MPKGPKGQKRPADVIGNAIKIARIATGEIEDDSGTPADDGKDKAAVALGRKGGAARAACGKPEQEAAEGDREEGRQEPVGKITGY